MEESAAKVVSQIPPSATDHHGNPRQGHPFVTSQEQFLALQSAAEAAQSPDLARLVRHGVGFHSAGLCPEDRGLVEALFLKRRIQARTLAGMPAPCAALWFPGRASSDALLTPRRAHHALGLHCRCCAQRRPWRRG